MILYLFSFPGPSHQLSIALVHATTPEEAIMSVERHFRAKGLDENTVMWSELALRELVPQEIDLSSGVALLHILPTGEQIL
jgi:hypothetical protein